jgi:hypothetical protein
MQSKKRLLISLMIGAIALAGLWFWYFYFLVCCAPSLLR